MITLKEHFFLKEQKILNDKLLDEISRRETPDFVNHQPDFKALEKFAKKFKKFKNILLIGNGGSRTSSLAFYRCLANYRNKKKFIFITSGDPDKIARIKKDYTIKDTLILAVSKSGSNMNVLEALLLLPEYPVAVITQTDNKKNNTLYVLAQKKKWPIFPHPKVGGRFSAMTSSALIPAILMGLEVKKIYQGAKEGYAEYGYHNKIINNPALALANKLLRLEKKGYTEIFTAVYSEDLFGIFPLVVQLFHESVSKKGKGQTIFGDQAPEVQHHTVQRFFSGRRNVLGLFWGVKKMNEESMIKISQELEDIKLGDKTLKEINGLTGAEGMKFDREGLKQNAMDEKIPAGEIILDEITPLTIGKFIVFWQWLAVYSALLRKVNPFDQPGVEASKQISIKLKINRAGIN